MKFQTKRPFTLIELLISLSLTLLVLTALTYFYQQMTQAGAVMDRVQNEGFRLRYVEHRLGMVMPRAIGSTDPSHDFHFFSSPELGELFMPGSSSLVFTFDNCVQHNKEMAYHVIGRLFLDKEGRLILATWPTEKRWVEGEVPSVSYEVLFEEVKALSFQFFIPPKKGKIEESGKKGQKDLIPPELRGQWVTEWKKEFRQLPAIVKISIKAKVRGEDSTLVFAYPLPHVLEPITYDR